MIELLLGILKFFVELFFFCCKTAPFAYLFVIIYNLIVYRNLKKLVFVTTYLNKGYDMPIAILKFAWYLLKLGFVIFIACIVLFICVGKGMGAGVSLGEYIEDDDTRLFEKIQQDMYRRNRH